jgi:hypothetical protein
MLTMRRPAMRRAPVAATPGEWSRARLLAAMTLLAALCLSVAAGLGVWLWLRLQPAAAQSAPAPAATSAPAATPDTDNPAATARAVQARRDALAAAPMPSVGASAAQPGVLSTRDPGVIVLPAATSTGPAGIPTGFGHTVEGALAQLVAIDTDVLTTASLDRAREVIGGWAAPGGPTGESWSAVKALAGFHSAARLSGGANPGLAIRATAMMGLVKATDGADWALVCVDFEVDVTLAQTARAAVADCQRMLWADGRWVIGPGPEPAPAPSIWPGTDAAIDAGYRTLRHA